MAEKSKALERASKDEHRMIAGVCYGLARYFNVDPKLIRIIFVVMMVGFGFGLLPYLILWLVMPKAKTF